ncbi:MAG: CHAD domain-containing protein [Pseudonocardia sp.]|nr:CHAD domain-containing protein [Pseudonocardia sp.]
MTYLRAQRDRLGEADRAVRCADPDGAFDLRAAVRRTRAALRTYRPLVEDPDLVTELIDELRWLGREVSALRDAQVARERITAALAELDDGLWRGPVHTRALRYFERAEARAQATLFEALDSARWAAVRDKVDALNDDPPLTDLAARPAPDGLLVHLRVTARMLAEAVHRGDTSDAGLHAIRKVARHLRESALVARPVVGRPAKRFDRRLEKFRRLLGEHQDSVVSRRALDELVTEADLAGESAFAFGVLYGRESARAEAVRATLPRYWRKAWRPEHLDWLDAELAEPRTAHTPAGPRPDGSD